MHIFDMNWMQVDAYLKSDDRAVIPLGSTEQHAFLSLGVDTLLAERVALEAADPLGVPVFPALPYGLAPYFLSYAGTVSLRVETYLLVMRDLLDSLSHSGFRRILIVNGHGGNSAVEAFILEWRVDHSHMQVKFHNWWNAPHTWAKVQEIDPLASHASWMENFPWTRLPGVKMPAHQKRLPDRTGMPRLVGQALRDYLGDGNFAGYYQRADEEMLDLWRVAVDETRALIAGGWD